MLKFEAKQMNNNEEMKQHLKDEMIEQRQQEISKIIDRLGDETHQQQKELVAKYEDKIKWLEHSNEDDMRSYAEEITQLREENRLRQE